MGRMTIAAEQMIGYRRSLRDVCLGIRSILWLLGVLVISLTPENPQAAEVVDSARYIVGPGDEFTVSFSDANIEPIETLVGIEGIATIDGVGKFSLAGLTLTTAKARLLAGLKRRFSGSGPELRLTTVREKRTLVAGAVEQPGIYSSKATALVSDLIAKAGGLAPGASRRNIEIRSERDGETETYQTDLEMFSIVGDLKANPSVYLGDVIYVPLIADSSQGYFVSGETRSPRWIEYNAQDNVMDLIRLASGLSGNARRDSALFFDGSSAANTQLRMISLSQTKTLLPGSRVIALSRGEKKIATDVSITGAIANPGRYPYLEGMTINSLISDAGGTSDQAYVAGITLFNSSSERGALVDSLVDAEDQALGEANLFAPTGPQSAANVRSGLSAKLAPGDSVVVPFTEGFISVLGQVRIPGLVTFVPGRSAFDYLSSAGGTNSWADLEHSYVTRKIALGATPLASANNIYDGDIIFVAKRHEKRGSGALRWIRDVTLIGAGVALTVFAIDKVGN